MFKVLCKNNTLASHPGFDVDDNCYLSITTTSEVVTRRDDELNNDISLALAEFEYRFNLKSPFKLFDDFNGKKDLLFQVSY